MSLGEGRGGALPRVCTRVSLGGLCAALAVCCGCAAAGPREPTLTAEQHALELDSFDTVWNTVNEHYWDPTFGGVNWQGVRDELRPKVEQVSTRSESRAVLEEMISRLGVSHFGVFPAEIYKDLELPEDDRPHDGATGIDVRVVDGHALVTRVDPELPAERMGVRTGWEVIRVGDNDVPEFIAQRRKDFSNELKLPAHLSVPIIIGLRGARGESVDVAFRDGAERIVELSIPLEEPRGESQALGVFGEIRAWIDVRTIAGDIGYIAFSGFVNPTYIMGRINEAMRTYHDAPGLIIDLRGNGGGLGAMAMGLAGWLVEDKQLLGTQRTRDSELRFIIQPRLRGYRGPVAVLVDGLSGSASEFLAGGLQQLGRACVIGTRTIGEALPGQFTTLPNGDVFLYATSDFEMFNGRKLEGVGVIPDIEVPHTREALLAGRDLAIEAGVQWIRAQASAVAAERSHTERTSLGTTY